MNWDEFVDQIESDRLDVNMHPDGRITTNLNPADPLDALPMLQYMGQYPTACQIALAFCMITEAAKIQPQETLGALNEHVKAQLKPYEYLRNPSQITRTAYEVFRLYDAHGTVYPDDYPRNVVTFARVYTQIVDEIRRENEFAIRSQHPLPSPAGYVYLLKNTDGVYKIGTSRHPRNRLKTFKTELPFDVQFEHVMPSPDAKSAESIMHVRFQKARIRGEWFQLSPEQVEEIKRIKWL